VSKLTEKDACERRLRAVNCKPKENDNTFLVQCIWCGAKIRDGAKVRDDKEEDTSGVCLQCFYQILSNHLSAQKRSAYGEFVSDR
jgi:hypothetical protein